MIVLVNGVLGHRSIIGKHCSAMLLCGLVIRSRPRSGAGPSSSPTRYTWASVSCIVGRCKSPASAQLASRNAGAEDVSVLMLLQVLPFISHSTARASGSREPQHGRLKLSDLLISLLSTMGWKRLGGRLRRAFLFPLTSTNASSGRCKSYTCPR